MQRKKTDNEILIEITKKIEDITKLTDTKALLDAVGKLELKEEYLRVLNRAALIAEDTKTRPDIIALKQQFIKLCADRDTAMAKITVAENKAFLAAARQQTVENPAQRLGLFANTNETVENTEKKTGKKKSEVAKRYDELFGPTIEYRKPSM